MIKQTTSKLIKYWSESTDFDANTRAEIQNLIKKKNKEELVLASKSVDSYFMSFEVVCFIIL